jgi:hypothetical protein
MVPATRDFLIRSHGKVIGHCRAMLTKLPANDADRNVLERRIAAEQAALEALVAATVSQRAFMSHPYQPRSADNENNHPNLARLGA